MVNNKAAIYAGKRKIDLAMVALPMGEKVDELVTRARVSFSIVNQGTVKFVPNLLRSVVNRTRCIELTRGQAITS